MEGTLYLPYYDYNDGAFDVSNSYYDSDEYARKMKEEYDKSKDVVYNSMNDFKNGCLIRRQPFSNTRRSFTKRT